MRRPMRLRLGLTAVVLLAMTSLPAFAQWNWGRPHRPRSGACFYRDGGFRGDYFCMKVGERWPSLPPGFNDRISSIRLFGGARVRIFIDERYRGISTRFDGDIVDLHSVPLPDNRHKNWNDRISSIAVFLPERDEWGPRGGDRGWDRDRDRHRDRDWDRDQDRDRDEGAPPPPPPDRDY